MVFKKLSRGLQKKVLGVFQGSFRTVSRVLRKFQRCFKEVPRCFKKVSWVLFENSKGVLRVFIGWFKKNSKDLLSRFQVSRGVQVSFMEVSRKFQENFIVFNKSKDVSSLFFFWKFIFACHSAQLPEEKEGLFLVLKSFNGVSINFKGVSRMFKGHKLQECVKEV